MAKYSSVGMGHSTLAEVGFYWNREKGSVFQSKDYNDMLIVPCQENFDRSSIAQRFG